MGAGLAIEPSDPDEGAYFIRRRSRGALYRKILERYVQMATAGGVAQGIFPEGGLSLTGRMMPPKMGLLSYIVGGYQDGARDIVFVPVAINYDRVLEDRVLIAAGARGDRRFGARISVVVRFILRKFWQGIRGRYVRFGTAAVVFGAPLSLKKFGAERPVEDLADTLMGRIGDAMPVLIVPLLSRRFLEAQEPLTLEELQAQIKQDARQHGRRMPSMTEAELEEAVLTGLAGMERNGMVEPTTGASWQIVAGQEAVVSFYAQSLTGIDTENCAVAE